MTDTVTLLTLRTKVRQRADMVSSQFVTDTEVNTYIQDSYKELYDLLVDAVEDYNLVSNTSTSLISTGNVFTLPTDFYKLRGIDDLTDSVNPRTVRKFMFSERNSYYLEYSDLLYRIVGNQVEIIPPESAPRQYRVWYVPLPTVPLVDSDTINAINGFDEYVVVDAAIKCLIKAESDVSPLRQQKGDLLDRIIRMRTNRDQALPERVSRVRSYDRGSCYGYRREF